MQTLPSQVLFFLESMNDKRKRNKAVVLQNFRPNSKIESSHGKHFTPQSIDNCRNDALISLETIFYSSEIFFICSSYFIVYFCCYSLKLRNVVTELKMTSKNFHLNQSNNFFFYCFFCYFVCTWKAGRFLHLCVVLFVKPIFSFLARLVFRWFFFYYFLFSFRFSL